MCQSHHYSQQGLWLMLSLLLPVHSRELQVHKQVFQLHQLAAQILQPPQQPCHWLTRQKQFQQAHSLRQAALFQIYVFLFYYQSCFSPIQVINCSATLVCRPLQNPRLTWTTMRKRLTQLCWRAKPRPRPKLLPRPKEKRLPSQRARPKPKSQLQPKPSLLPRSKPKQRHRQWFPDHLAKLPAKDTMVCHLKVAHMAASDVEETSKDAANACSQGMVVCDSAAGQIGPLGTKPWKPTSEWAQITAQLSNQAICTGDAKRFAKGDVQIGLALKPCKPFLKSSHVLKKVLAWWHCIFSDITQEPCWHCTLIHLLASCDNHM